MTGQKRASAVVCFGTSYQSGAALTAQHLPHDMGPYAMSIFSEPGASFPRRLALTYWRVFNFMTRRVMAVCFVVGGLVLFAFGVPTLLPGGTVMVNGAASDDMVYRAFGTLTPLLLSVLGGALFRTKPYLPPWHAARSDQRCDES